MAAAAPSSLLRWARPLLAVAPAAACRGTCVFHAPGHVSAAAGAAASSGAARWARFDQRQAFSSEGQSFVPPQLRVTRNRDHHRRKGPPPTRFVPTPNSEVSPKRKKRFGARAARRSRRFSTDLEDLERAERNAERNLLAGGRSPPGEWSASDDAGARSGALRVLPSADDRGIRRFVQRPVASLPRSPRFFVKFGPPMTVEDLQHDAPSVLFESRKMIEEVLERRQTAQADPDHVSPDTPFWRLPTKKLYKKPAQWRDGREESAATDAAGDPAAGGGSASAGAGVADQLRGISDVTPPQPRGWRAAGVAPARWVSEVMEEAAEPPAPEGPGEAAGGSSSSVPGESLVSAIRRRAEEFERSGVHPDIKDSLVEAMRHHPGAERAARLQEMRACTLGFEELVAQGKASVANCNELIRAQALRGDMEAAMQTANAMKLHGYELNDGTFVSLLLGAGHLKDAELARQIYLSMREQLITATPKVYAALIQAHVRANDVASGFALMRKMQDEKLQPDIVIYTTLINALVTQGHLEKAWEEFHSMRTWKLIEPDEVLFTVMIKACAKASEPERALNMLDDLRMTGLYPTDLTYGELIHAMATTPEFAHKAFDFYRHMQAEDLPISSFIFEKLLQACKTLGDPKRAQTVIKELQEHGAALEPAMYCHLVGLFATAMRQPKVSEQEKARNLRCAWRIVADARRRHLHEIDWTAMLNEVMSVYVAGGFPGFAVDLLQHYPVFNASPDLDTYRCLLELLGRDLKDVGRFFMLWSMVPRTPRPPDELYQLALEVALESRSAQRTCAVLEEFVEARVFPSPQLTARLATAGRHVLQIHGLVAKLISLNKEMRVESVRRDNLLLQTHMEERETELAAIGLTVRSPTPAQEVRDRYFDSLHKRGFFRRTWMPHGQYVASKKKGGEAYAKRHDKPRPNILAA